MPRPEVHLTGQSWRLETLGTTDGEGGRSYQIMVTPCGRTPGNLLFKVTMARKFLSLAMLLLFLTASASLSAPAPLPRAVPIIDEKSVIGKWSFAFNGSSGTLVIGECGHTVSREGRIWFGTWRLLGKTLILEHSNEKSVEIWRVKVSMKRGRMVGDSLGLVKVSR